ASVHDVGEGSLEGGHQVAYEGIITGGLPCQPGGLDETELGVSLHRGPDILGPVLTLAGKFFGKGCEVVKDAAVARLVVSEVFYYAYEVILGIAQCPHHVRVISYPDRAGIRRYV